MLEINYSRNDLLGAAAKMFTFLVELALANAFRQRNNGTHTHSPAMCAIIANWYSPAVIENFEYEKKKKKKGGKKTIPKSLSGALVRLRPLLHPHDFKSPPGVSWKREVCAHHSPFTKRKWVAANKPNTILLVWQQVTAQEVSARFAWARNSS